MPETSSERIVSTRAISVSNPGNPLYPFQRKVRFKDEAKLAEVLEDFKRIYDYWEGQGNLRSRLRQWQSDSEGVVNEPPLFPWPDSSSVVKHVIETRQNIIHAFFMSIIRPLIGKLFTCTVSNKASPEERTWAKKIAAAFNTDHDFNKMYVDSVDEAFWAVLVDGTVGRTCDWLRVVEPRWESKTYTDLDTFQTEFPVPAALGVSVEKYLEYVSTLSSQGILSLDLERDVIVEDRPDIDMELLKDLVIYPLTVSKQERTRFIGKMFKKRKSELKALEKDGLYHNIDKVIQMTPQAETDLVEQNQNIIEGVTEPSKKEDYKFIHGRYLADLDGDGIEEKYLVTYSVDARVFVQFDKYPFWHNKDNIQLSQFKRKPKRLLGRGVAEMLSDNQLEATIQARFRINSNSITNAPMLIVDETLKDKINPERRDGRIRPGGAWYVPASKYDKAVKPLELPDRERGDAIAEEGVLARDADNLLGASELRSGREVPSDPRAPAAKTALLLQQSGMRLDDFIFGFILKENVVLDMAKKLQYQFGAEKLSFNVEEQGQMVKEEIDKSWFNSENIHLQLSVTSLLDNPEYLKGKWEEFYAKYGQEPMLGSLPPVRWEILKQIVQNMPEADGVNILLPLEQINQMAMANPAPMGGPNGANPPGNPPINPTLKNALSSPRPPGGM